MTLTRTFLLVTLLVLNGGLWGCSDPKEDPPEEDMDVQTDGDDTDAGDDLDEDGDALGDGDGEADMEPPSTECMQLPAEDVSGMQSINGWTVRWAGDGSWSVDNPSGNTVLEGPGTCAPSNGGNLPAVRAGSREPNYQFSFGAFVIDLRPGAMRPASGEQPTVDATENEIRITWPLLETGADGPDMAALVFTPEGENNLRIELEAPAADSELVSGEMAFTCRPDEGFFGLGTQVTGMDLRGHEYPLITQEQGNSKPEGGGIFPLNNIPEAAYAPMGLWHSSEGYSAIVTHDGYHEIDLCRESEERLSLRSYPDHPGIILVAGDTPRERLTGITEYTGRVDDLPAWVFGPWNDAVGGPDRLQTVSDTLRSEGIPSSAIWSEDWIGGSDTMTGFRLSYAWEWDPTQYPDLPTDIDTLHDRGFAFLAYFNPFVPDTTRMFNEGVAGNYLIETSEGEAYTFQDPAFRDASLVDLTNPEAVSWLMSYQITAAEDLAIDGWMADFAEWLPPDSVVASGESPWRVHNRYPLLWQQANRDSMETVHNGMGAEPANNWTYFARSGWASANGGTAGIAPTMWGGDNDTDWDYDDGFPTVVPIGAHVGLSGVAVFGSDIAGYTTLSADATTKELFYRWSALGALSPLMRTHHGDTECENWSFDRDAETIDHYRRWSSVHVLLYPYFRQRLAESQVMGWPIIRHPWLVFPDQPALWQDQNFEWFLGDDLLVCPVMEEGATERDIVLPAEDWLPLFDNQPPSQLVEQADGSWAGTVPAPVTELPVFVRPGTILPLLSEPVDSFYGATQMGVTDLEDVADQYRLALYPASDGSLTTLELEDATISASGIGYDWPGNAEVLVDGTPISTCGMGNPNASCIEGDGRLRIVGDTVMVTAGTGTVEIASPITRTWWIGVGATAWGDLAQATTVTNLDPMIPPPCEE